MDMHSRNEYLKELQERYFMTRSKKERSSMLDEYCTNTHQNRKYVISKINSRLSSKPKKRKKRKKVYDGYVKEALAKVWEIFDCPCGQRLAPLLRTEIARLRQLEEVFMSNEVAKKLERISPRTIDRALKHQKEVLHLNRKYKRKRNPLIYQRIPIKAGGWDRFLPGQVQIDLVEHCGRRASGLFINTVSSCDVATGWWEGEGVMGSGQERTFEALTRIRERTPFGWLHIHPDNDGAFINWHLVAYAEKEQIDFSRSRPFKKNDNNFVEQKNSTHVRRILGHLRYDTEKELTIINKLYRNEWRLYKNFFQPVMKLQEKIRDKGKVHRKYDVPKTPYHRLIESEHIPQETKQKLTQLYQNLNPAELKRKIDMKIHGVFRAYQEKNGSSQIDPLTKQQRPTVRFYMTQQGAIGLGS